MGDNYVDKHRNRQAMLLDSSNLFSDKLGTVQVDVASYIIGYYSQVRPHSFNDYLTPVEKEIQFFNQNLLKAV